MIPPIGSREAATAWDCSAWGIQGARLRPCMHPSVARTSEAPTRNKAPAQLPRGGGGVFSWNRRF
jgi:hypothetical protein